MKIEYHVVGVRPELPQAKQVILDASYSRPILDTCRTVEEARKKLKEYQDNGYKHLDICKAIYEWMGRS